MQRTTDSIINFANYILDNTPQKKSHHFQDTLSKVIKIQEKTRNFVKTSECSMNLEEIFNYIEKILNITQKHKDYFNSDKIFRDDFNKTFSTLKSIFRFVSKLLNPAKIQLNTEILEKDIENIKSSLAIFSDIFDKMIPEKLNPDDDDDIFDIKLGLECSLFNACVDIEELEEFPFIKSKFLTIYQFYKEIDKIEKNISLIKSYCGTGKTTFLPLFLFIKNLRENNSSPFILMTTQTPTHVDFKKMHYEKLLSKYLTITGDTNMLIELYNDHEKGQIGQKLTLGILTSYNLLPLMNELKDNKIFISSTRFIIDDLHQKSFHHSVIISQIMDLNEKKAFNMALHVVLLSSYFPPEILKTLESVAEVTSLVDKPLYAIKEEPFMYQMVARIDLKILKVVKSVINRMAIKKQPQNAEAETMDKTEQANKDKIEQKTKSENEQKTINETEQKTKSETEQKTKSETEQKTKSENEQKTKSETEQKTKSETEQKTKSETEQKTKSETEQKTKSETEQKTKSETEQKTKSETEQKTKSENEQKTKSETEQKTKSETEQKTKSETEQKNKDKTKQKTKVKSKQKTKNETETNPKNNNKVKNKIEDGHIICFLPNTGICNNVKNSLFTAKLEDGKDKTSRKVFILGISLKTDEKLENFYGRLKTRVDKIKKKEGKECLFFIPIVISGVKEHSSIFLATIPFPKYLKDVHKLILSTNFFETFCINDVSVVIDSALTKELVFDPIICITNDVEKKASDESLYLRKGRLGHTMKGLYILFTQKMNNDSNKTEKKHTAMLERDITQNYLSMKELNIDFDTLKNLPYEAKKENCDFTVNLLKRVGAIDAENHKITQFGLDMQKIGFDIPILYKAAIIKYSQSFDNELDRNYGFFISVYISLIITMDKILIKEEISNDLKKYYDENSDIVTLYNIYNKLLCPNDDDNNTDLKHCFPKINKLYDNLQQLTDSLFPDMKVSNVIQKLSVFESKYGGIYNIIDSFIAKFDDDWKKIHYLRLGIIRKIKTNEDPELVFFADNRLKSDKNQAKGRVFVLKRPACIFPSAPSDCYCFNISLNVENQTYQRYIGHLIHRNDKSFQAITTLEIPQTYILNPWFNVLTDAYFNDIENKNEEEKIKFFSKQIDDKVYLSFKSILRDKKENEKNIEKSKNYQFIKTEDAIKDIGEKEIIIFLDIDEIYKGIKICIEIFPYTPRSVLIYNSKYEVITEVKSTGSDGYESLDATNFYGKRLNKFMIDYYHSNRHELAKTFSDMRICCLFIEDTCKYSKLDREYLYIIDKSTNAQCKLLSVVQNRVLEMEKTKCLMNDEAPADECGLFQFNPWFIHPSLFYHPEANASIMNWFDKYCDFIKIKGIKGHKIRMKLTDIQKLQNHLFFKAKQVIKEMNLEYKAIPFPKFLKKQFPKKWYTNSSYNTVIVKAEEANEVINFIQKRTSKMHQHVKNNHLLSKFQINPSCCYNDCDTPDLSELPFTILLNDQDITEVSSMKLCKYCILDRLHYVTQAFFTNEQINFNALEKIDFKPHSITYICSVEHEKGEILYPQIPLGQYISVLFNCNHKALSTMTSAYLKSISEFTIRYKMRNHLTFCREHPHKIYKINGNHDSIECCHKDCNFVYCNACKFMHPKDFVCLTKSSEFIKVCPECFLQILKGAGCKSIRCKCGTIFCYECGIKLQTQTEAYTHFMAGHPKKSNEDNNDNNNDNDGNNNNNDINYTSFSVNSIFSSSLSETTFC